MVVHIVNALIAHGKVERGWLGVSTQEVTSDLGKALALPKPEGAFIADVDGRSYSQCPHCPWKGRAWLAGGQHPGSDLRPGQGLSTPETRGGIHCRCRWSFI